MTGAREQEPHSQRHQLATELRRLRKLAGLSGEELAQRIGISQSKVSRIESTALLPSLPEVDAWSQTVQASTDARQALRELTKAAFTEVHIWRARARGRAGFGRGELREREARARTILNLQITVIPGLLQTAEYARQMFSIFQIPYSSDELAAAVANRLERQLILYGDKHFEFLISETALRARYGSPQTLLAQLDRIASLSTLNNISIGLIPHRHQVLASLSHGFVIYEGHEEEETLVTVEAIHGQLAVTEPDDVRFYRGRWNLLRRSALFDEQARDFLTEISASIRDQGP